MQAPTINTQRSIILIVDDQIDNIQVLALALEQQRYSITYALSGKEALERLQVIQPDLILLDLFMPGMDGLQVCETIKADPNYQEIPILFLTASHEQEHFLEAFEKGAADYITKPFRLTELLARVKTHIQLRQQARALQQSKDKLETIVQYIKDGIIVVNRDGIILFTNPAAAQMFNRPLVTMIGHELGRPLVDQHLTKIQILRQNGQIGQAEITVAKAEWDNQPVSIICVRDLSN